MNTTTAQDYLESIAAIVDQIKAELRTREWASIKLEDCRRELAFIEDQLDTIADYVQEGYES